MEMDLIGTEGNLTNEWSEFIRMALKDEPYWLRMSFAILMLLVFIVSLVGNSLTCLVIYYDKTMHTATNYYLFNLAVSDLLVTFPILLMLYQVVIQDTDLLELGYSLWANKFLIYLDFIFVSILWNNRILVLTALSIERYVGICHPMILKGTQVWRRVGKIIVAIWVVAIVEAIPQAWTLEVIETDKAVVCFFLQTDTAKVIIGTHGVMTFLLPLVIMVLMYTMIALKVTNSQKYDLHDTLYTNGFKRIKVNKLITLTVSFVICWLPYFFANMLVFVSNIHTVIRLSRWYTIISKIASFNSWFTTVLNPILFSLMSIKFRKALKMLWDTKVKKKYFQVKKRLLDTSSNPTNDF